MHVTIPVDVEFAIPTTVFTFMPFELLIVLILCSTGFNPFGVLKILTEDIELEVKLNSITPWSVNNPVSGSTTTKSGTER